MRTEEVAIVGTSPESWIENQCDAWAYKPSSKSHSGIVGRPQTLDVIRCSRKLNSKWVHADMDMAVKGFCKQHEKMAQDGYIDGGGVVMDPKDRANYRRGRMGSLPLDMGKWEKLPACEMRTNLHIPTEPKRSWPLATMRRSALDKDFHTYPPKVAPSPDHPTSQAYDLSGFLRCLEEAGLKLVKMLIPNHYEPPTGPGDPRMERIVLTSCGMPEGVIYRYEYVGYVSVPNATYLRNFLEIRGYTVTEGEWTDSMVKDALVERRTMKP